MFLFGFNKFIAPTVIKFFYYIGLLISVFGGLGVITYAITEMEAFGAQFSMQLIFGAIIGVPIIVLFLRFSTELWLVLFEMNERLAEIRDRK